ncbi:hypothetical protein HanXRQr2_Chr07g0297231 [Helianthus annuus]|uniref:Uncharacterized protein n=1 Tax=Helianthus annuus TaxID=4232 RepID=A0A251VKU6_HELAN|nr:uncharacterized protein LOC110943186 [Helianthus annuus]KAF5798807.1 hypothetical protein HanXRQr2_Chr07g0297231 [Helianthus annuus]KAJ0557063.1 hypothetical protein HanIR_Chr07g0320881 [Helianthus annuus]KAJ0904908.1 hypothetical protein HanPSC8_Chr07g0287751 [Helianthus annuus]
MKRKDRQQKLHNSLINMLYPPSSSSPHHNKQLHTQTLNLAQEIINSESHPINTDELEEEEEEERSEGEGELGFEKLTRAQRKRLRKKKLKEAASQRRQIIGPQLNPDHTDGDRIDGEVSSVRELEHEHERLEGVRRNAAEKP